MLLAAGLKAQAGVYLWNMYQAVAEHQGKAMVNAWEGFEVSSKN